MKIKPKQKVRFVEAGTDFLVPESQDIIWRYGVVYVVLKRSCIVIEDGTKDRLKISKYLIFPVH
jgi:hypothetical protein